MHKHRVPPFYHHYYESFRDAILESKLKPGLRIPPTRILAKDLKISRNTVVCAFDQLITEGYIEGKVGVGSFVSRALPEEILQLRMRNNRSKKVHIQTMIGECIISPYKSKRIPILFDFISQMNLSSIITLKL